MSWGIVDFLACSSGSLESLSDESDEFYEAVDHEDDLFAANRSHELTGHGSPVPDNETLPVISDKYVPSIIADFLGPVEERSCELLAI